VSKKSFQNLKLLFKKKGYKFREFDVSFVGNYAPEDADWNYKDVKHLNIAHKTVHGIQAIMTDDVMCNINLQKIPFIGLEIPMPLIQYDASKNNAIYISALGPYIIIVNSLFEEFKNNQTKITTKFSIGSKGIFKILNPLIEYLLKKNNELLMQDDLPMRNRRGELRKNNHLFYKKTDNYSFEFSENIERSNVYLDKNKKNFIDIEKKKIFEAKDGDIIGEKNGILSFLVTIDSKGKKTIWPSTCSHEGASLSKSCSIENYLICPWHNRKVNSLIIIENANIQVKLSIDYAIKVADQTISFKYRNNPSYYEKKPYEFLKYED